MYLPSFTVYLQCAYLCGLLPLTTDCLNDEASVLKYCDRWLGYKML